VAVALPMTEDKLKSVTGGITVTSDVKLDFNANAADATAAKEIDDKLTEVIKSFQDFAGLLVLQEKDFAPVIDILGGIKHDAKDSVVTIKSDIKGEVIEKLVKAAAQLAAKTGTIK
jgi:hypothetical protein